MSLQKCRGYFWSKNLVLSHSGSRVDSRSYEIKIVMNTDVFNYIKISTGSSGPIFSSFVIDYVSDLP